MHKAHPVHCWKVVLNADRHSCGQYLLEKNVLQGLLHDAAIRPAAIKSLNSLSTSWVPRTNSKFFLACRPSKCLVVFDTVALLVTAVRQHPCDHVPVLTSETEHKSVAISSTTSATAACLTHFPDLSKIMHNCQEATVASETVRNTICKQAMSGFCQCRSTDLVHMASLQQGIGGIWQEDTTQK